MSVERASLVFPDVAVGIARVAQEQRKPAEAEEYLRSAIEAQPERVQPYAAMAIFLRSQSRLDDALKVLLDGERAVGVESAEIQYQLGMFNLEAGHVDAAVRHAVKAYELGYPLPGLRKKLMTLGRWPTDPSDHTGPSGG